MTSSTTSASRYEPFKILVAKQLPTNVHTVHIHNVPASLTHGVARVSRPACTYSNVQVSLTLSCWSTLSCQKSMKLTMFGCCTSRGHGEGDSGTRGGACRMCTCIHLMYTNIEHVHVHEQHTFISVNLLRIFVSDSCRIKHYCYNYITTTPPLLFYP